MGMTAFCFPPVQSMVRGLISPLQRFLLDRYFVQEHNSFSSRLYEASLLDTNQSLILIDDMVSLRRPRGYLDACLSKVVVRAI